MNTQNESPFGNPRFILSIIAVFLFLWGWQFYVNKTYPQPVPKPAATMPAGATEAPAKAASTQTGDSKVENEIKIAASSTPKSETKFIYEDDKVKWEISSEGMGLSSLQLKSYFDREKTPILFTSDERLFSSFIENQPVHYELNKVSETQYVGQATVNGKNIKRTLVYNKELMSFDSELEFEAPPTAVSFSVTEKKHKVSSGNFLMPSFEHHDFLYKDGEKVKTEHISGRKEGESFSVTANNVALASIGSQYFTQSYVDKSEISPSVTMSLTGELAKLSVNYNLTNAKVSKLKSLIYIGPKLPDRLEKIDILLPEVMDYGIFGFISKPLLLLMKFMFGIFGNWGLAIIALTIVMRLLMLPFNVISFKSARAMQRIQPQLQAVREKYKNDPMQVNRETMALMKQHNANPLSSCLPMLVQIPIFFALWKTIGSSIEIYQQPFFGWITDLSAHDHFFVLPVLMGITMFFQQKLTPTTMDPTQAKILNFMPILFSVFMLSLPSGLTLYNFVSALFGVAQQYFLLRDNTKK